MTRSTDRLGMTIAVDWDVKPQTNQTKQKKNQKLNCTINENLELPQWAIECNKIVSVPVYICSYKFTLFR